MSEKIETFGQKMIKFQRQTFFSNKDLANGIAQFLLV